MWNNLPATSDTDWSHHLFYQQMKCALQERVCPSLYADGIHYVSYETYNAAVSHVYVQSVYDPSTSEFKARCRMSGPTSDTGWGSWNAAGEIYHDVGLYSSSGYFNTLGKASINSDLYVLYTLRPSDDRPMVSDEFNDGLSTPDIRLRLANIGRDCQTCNSYDVSLECPISWLQTTVHNIIGDYTPKPDWGGEQSDLGVYNMSSWREEANIPSDGFTRKYPREISSLSESGSDGWSARYTGDGLVYVYSDGTWGMQSNVTSPDLVTAYGYESRGDYIGPWLYNELHRGAMVLRYKASQNKKRAGVSIWERQGNRSGSDAALARTRALSEYNCRSDHYESRYECYPNYTKWEYYSDQYDYEYIAHIFRRYGRYHYRGFDSEVLYVNVKASDAYDEWSSFGTSYVADTYISSSYSFIGNAICNTHITQGLNTVSWPSQSEVTRGYRIVLGCDGVGPVWDIRNRLQFGSDA